MNAQYVGNTSVISVHYGFSVMNANSGLMDVEGAAPDIYICDLCDHR